MKLDKEATKQAIIDTVRSSNSMTMSITSFRNKINSEEDILNACTFCRVEPIYIN